MKKKMLIIIAVLTAILIAAGIGIGAVVSYMLAPPLEKLERAVNRSVDAIIKNSDAAQTLEKVLNGGSIEVSGNLRPIIEAVADVGFDVNGSARMYFGKSDELALETTLGMGMSAVNAVLYMDSDKLALTSEAMTGGEAYGLRFDDLAERWDNSVFAKSDRYSIDIDENKAASALRVRQRCDELEANINAALSDFEAAIFDILEEYGHIDAYAGSLDIGGTSHKTFDVILTLEGEAIVDSFEDLLKRLKQIDSIEALLSANSELILPILNNLGITVDSSIYSEFAAILDEAVYALEAVKDTFDGANFTAKVQISKTTTQIIGIELGFSNVGTDMTVKIVCGPTWDNIEVMSISYSDSNGDTISAAYTVDQNTESAYKAVLSAQAYGEPLDIGGKIFWDKTDGNLAINLDIYDFKFVFDGSYVSGNRNKVIVINKLIAGENDLEPDGLEVTFSIAAGMPTVKKHHDILNMTDDEVDKLLNSIGSAIGNIFAAVIG